MAHIFETRLNRFRKFLHDEAIDVAFVTSPTNIYYYTGFYSDPHERFMALAVDNKRERVTLFVPALDVAAAEQAARVDGIIPVADTDDPYDKLRAAVAGDVRLYGVEKDIVSLAQYEALSGVFSAASYVDIAPFIAQQRLKKAPQEIAFVREAVATIEQVLLRGLERFTVGMSELELTAEFEYQMKVLGADGPAFATTVLSGENSALPHGSPGQRRIQSGDFLLFDMGVFKDGYCSDISRTFIVGEGTARQEEIYETVRAANERATAAVQVGQPIGSLDRAAREYIEGCGYGKYFNHRVGHGLGLEVHEAPSIHGENKLAMIPGLLFTIEPGIYVPGLGGVRIEDDVYLGADGEVEVLTTFPKKLQRLG